MTNQSQHIEMPPAFIVGDKPIDPSNNSHSAVDNSVRSRNIEFEPVEIVGTPPQVIEMPPLEITVPKPDSSSKESSASPDSRATFMSPGSESKLQQDSKPTEISTTPIDRIKVETPHKESPTTTSDFSHRRQNWSDGPFDDHTEGGRLPSFVYPNRPESNTKPRLSKRKGKKKISKVEFDVLKRPEPQKEEAKKREIETKTAGEKIADSGGLAALQSENLYFPGEGYYYQFEWEVGNIKDGDTAEKAMQILQDDPDSIFPFGVEGQIKEGSRVNLRNPRFFFIPGLTTVLRYYGLSRNHVIVQRVSATSFTFRTESNHFDGADGLITFTTFERDGKVYLQQTGYAPTAGISNAVVAPPGAWASWNRQQANLENKLIDARKTQ